jgi:hypothetical protein
MNKKIKFGFDITALMFIGFLIVAGTAEANTTAKIGGTFVNIDESIVFTGSLDNKFETEKYQGVFEADYAYKAEDGNQHKASIENSIAYLKSNANNEPIIRSSLWYAFNMTNNISFTNKFLWESGDDDYTRNETSFDYSVTDNVTVGIKNVYTKDPIEYSIFNITLGVKF